MEGAVLRELAAEGFLLGLSVGGICSITCTPFLVPYLLSTGKGWAKAKVFGWFLTGRLAAYLLSGLAAGLAGRAVQNLASNRVKGLFLAIAAALLLAYSIRNLWRDVRSCPMTNAGHRTGPLVTGFLLGASLCPPFAVGLVRAFGLADAAKAMVYFFCLFLGTTVFLVPVPILSVWMTREIFRRLGTYLGILAGGWFLIQGMVLFLWS